MRGTQASLILMWAAFLFHNLGIFVVSDEVNFEDQKNFFFPDPNATTPPTVPYTPPAVSYTPPAAGGYSSPPPAVPSHGDGSTPPAHCANPPKRGGNHHPTPSPPTATGYHHSPPTPPITLTPPTTPPSPFDPNSPPFTCTYWRKHPTLVWGVFGWWGTVGSAFGVSGVGAQASLLQALSNTRTDGFGELYREGTAALLNSMAHTKFPYTTTHVRDSFVAALSSNKAASAQAQLFKLANEAKIKPRD